MSKPTSITGIWHGTYFGDAGYVGAADGLGVDFEIRIGAQSFWERLFGQFTGTVTDDPARGMPGTGTIRGSFHAPAIRFIKGMPVGYCRSGDRLITLRECLREQGADPGMDAPHAPIVYDGTFQPDGTASGTWIIEAADQLMIGGVRYAISQSTGTWTLRR